MKTKRLTLKGNSTSQETLRCLVSNKDNDIFDEDSGEDKKGTPVKKQISSVQKVRLKNPKKIRRLLKKKKKN